MDYGIFGLIPIVFILTIAVTTRRTILALVSGTAAGAIMIGKLGFLSQWITELHNGIVNETFQQLGLMVVGFGILIALLENSNAAAEFAKWGKRLMKTRRQALIGTFILSIVVFVDDYIHNLCVATTMRPVTDSLNIPRTRLGYIVNVMAASVAVLIPVASWAAVFIYLLDMQGVAVNGSASTAYMHAIPYIFYAWISIIIVFLSVIGVVPKIGPVKRDSIRAEETGNVFPPGYDVEYQELLAEQAAQGKEEGISEKGNPLFLLAPIFTMLVVAFLSNFLLGNIDVVLAVLVGDLVAVIIYLISKRLTVAEIMTSCMEGAESMMGMIIICLLATVMMNINTETGLVGFLQDVASANMSPKILPMCAFLICGIYAYVSGSFWDMAMIILPIIVPVAQAIGADVLLCSAAVFSGAAFGSNTCIYSDALIMCSQATKVKPADLMMGILPYAGISAAISAILYLVFGFIMC